MYKNCDGKKMNLSLNCEGMHLLASSAALNHRHRKCPPLRYFCDRSGCQVVLVVVVPVVYPEPSCFAQAQNTTILENDDVLSISRTINFFVQKNHYFSGLLSGRRTEKFVLVRKTLHLRFMQRSARKHLYEGR